MGSRENNALMVNTLQRCASVVVQNSIQEGFGLTVTEAMWKQRGVLGSQACTRLGHSAQRRVHDEFLVFTQARRWLETLAEMVRS
jgi:trehalose synthase